VIEWRAMIGYEFTIPGVFEKPATAQEEERNDCESSDYSEAMTKANPRLASGWQEWIPFMKHFS
jgi:hypothetical protein